MRKFLIPILNLVNLILISIVWGISNQTVVTDAARSDAKCGTFYDVVWMGSKANVFAIIGFFLFCFACALTLVAFLPLKVRKFLTCADGLMYVGAGVMFLIGPNPKLTYHRTIIDPELTGVCIAMAVLVFVAGAFALLMSALEFTEKKEEK